MTRRRISELVGGAASLLVVLALLQSAGASSAQVDEAVGEFTTPWGDPDLEGIWNHIYATTLERPAEYADREFLTDEEREAWDRRRAAAPRQNDTNIAERGTEQDVSGAYNAVFTSLRPTSPRTSLIIDPPDGRLPPVTEAVRRRRADYRAYQLAMLQATDVCKNNLAGCAGGTYGPPSPRRDEPPPIAPVAG